MGEEISLRNKEGNLTGEVVKIPQIFKESSISLSAIHQAVGAYLANNRQGSASTKTRGEVRGGGKKPWAQKHTRRARAGSIRSPLWRGGGVVFGPKPRDFSINLPKKIKRKALLSIITAKLRENKIILLDSLELPAPKTKTIIEIFSNLKVKKPLVVVKESDKNIMLSIRNIPYAGYMTVANLCAYEALKYKELILTKDAFSQLIERLK